MNILYCTHYAGNGGANLSLLNLIVSLRKRNGISAIVLLPEEGPFVARLKENGIDYIIVDYYDWVIKKEKKIIPLLGNIKNYLHNRKALYTISVFLEGRKVDIVHTNDSLTVIGAYIASKLGKPHVWHFREFLIEDYGLKFRYGKWYINYWFNKASYFIFISKAIQNRYKAYAPNNGFRLIYNGIPIEEHYNNCSQKYEQFTVFFSGGDSKEKGFDLLKPIIGDMVSNGIQLIIAGDIKNLENVSYLCGFESSVHCLGFINDIDYYRSKAQVSLMISKSEAFGRVTIESMVNQTIVVATNSGANGELIEQGRNGILLQENSPEELLKVLLHIKEHYRELQYIEEEAFEYARDNYSIERVSDEIIEVYSKLI